MSGRPPRPSGALRAEIASAYDARAGEYVGLFGSIELLSVRDHVTIDRWRDQTSGWLLDAGSGPGHWSDVLAANGRRDVLGLDASPRFVESAGRRFRTPRFAVGDLAALPLAAGSVGGILAWYSIIHTPPSDVPAMLAEFARVLSPGGSLLLGHFHGEAGVAFDHAVTTAYYWTPEALGDLLAPLGFTVERSETRQDGGARRRHAELVARLG
ncbi:class I SAM-dependent methyltransferase [Nocardioides sp.]|uniref:class I SAM-dependent methyltransferase n=1 Tax=Nocardioides sp. TaxID=35761 RepID=UPI002628692F|nr:class I SAM-dependent methyltransferase [Nocardioides sp.]